MLIPDYLCLLVFIYIYSCLIVFTYINTNAYPWLLVFTYV